MHIIIGRHPMGGPLGFVIFYFLILAITFMLHGYQSSSLAKNKEYFIFCI